MRHIPSRRALFLHNARAAYIWTGATWATTGGRAYNTPTLGSELYSNGGFDSDTIWIKGAGWTIAAGVATQAGATSVISQIVTTVGLWYSQTWQITANSGSAQGRPGINGPARTGTGSFVDTGRAAAVSAGCNANGVSIDNLSLKALTLSALPATVVGVAGQTVTAKMYAITTGTQVGVISHLDDAASPANFIVAYHDGGTSIKMDKCVGGTYSNLVSSTTGFVSDAVIEIRSLGSNQFDCYYNGTKRGSTATINDAGIINNTRYGLFSTYDANQFSDGLTLGGALIPFIF